MRVLPASGVDPADGRATRWPALAVHVWTALLPLLLLGPALAGGYVLSYDMVWVPDLALRSDFLGFGSALPRAVPSDAVVAVLDEVVPGMVLQKLALYGALVLVGAWAARLVAGCSTAARLAAVSLAVWNPFVVERLWIGHWPVLLGYAVVPWLVLAGRQVRREGTLAAAVWFLLPLGSLSANAGVVSILVLLISCAGGSASVPRRTWVALGLVGLGANAPWLVAGALHAGDTLATAGFGVFGLSGEGSLPAPLAALGLGGVWNSEVVPASREGALAWVALALVLALAAAGARDWWRGNDGQGDGDRDVRLVVLWGVGYGLALLTWLAPGAADAVAQHAPGAGLLRDGTRSLALCLPLIVVLIAHGVDAVLAQVSARAATVGLALACVLFPIAVMTDAAWGIGGQLRATHYPDSYSLARAAVGESGDDLLVLPFTSYRAPEWNSGRKVLDPLGRYLRPNYVVNDELSISGRVVRGEDPRVPEVQAALGLGSATERAAALGRLGIRFVARELDAPGAGDPGYDAEVAGRAVFVAEDLDVVEITGPVQPREASRGSVWLMCLAWIGFLGTIAAGLVKVVKRAVQR